jgi:hypothetical protein
MKNILLFWPNFISEGWFTIRYYKAIKSIKEELVKADLRIDWIGRIYTVVNIDESLVEQPDIMQQAFVFKQLGPINDILIKYGLSNDAFPELSKLNETSYLVVLYPENDNFNLYGFVRNLIFAGMVAASSYGIYLAVLHFIEIYK